MDHELEAAIDAVGRDRVFDAAKANGWINGMVPPKWVWWEIVAQLRLDGIKPMDRG